MKRWPIRPLGELCDVEGGNAAPQGDEHFKGGTISFVRMKDLGREHLTNNLTKTKDMLTEASAVANRMKLFDPGCILFPRSGSVALNHRAILGVPACIVSHIGVLQKLRPEITTGYLYLYLTTFDMTALSNKTTGVDSIAFADVKRIPVPLPPLVEQERIVKLLDEADELRKLRTQTDRRTADLIPALFHEMFGDPVVNPKNWPLKTIGEIAAVETGRTPSRAVPANFDGKIPWVKTTEVNGSIIIDTEEKLTDQGFGSVNGRLFPRSSIVLAMYGQGKTRGQSGVLAIEAFCNQACAVILPNEHFVTNFLFSYLQLSYARLRALARGGNQENLNLDIVRSFGTPLPPVPLQKEFAKRVTEIRGLEAEQARSGRRLEDLFQSLLHRAFRGEL